MSIDPTSILEIVRSVVGKADETVPLHEPAFEGREWEYVKSCIDIGWVSSAGKYVEKFGRILGEICGVKHAIPCVNGTAALHIALKLAGVESGDEVLIPSLTFVATANAVSYCNATPHFVESEIGTLGMDVKKLMDYLADIVQKTPQGSINTKTGKRIAAMVPMHVFGHPVDMDPLLKLANTFNIPVVEDAAEALGSLYKDKECGSFGRLAALSFNGNKIVTTGGGGAILTNDDDLAVRARHITTTAKKPHRWAFNHDEIGYNYRMPNINAALGCAQMEQLDGFLKDKRALAERYKKALSGHNGVRFVEEPKLSKSNYWLNAVMLDKGGTAQRDEVLTALNDAGYGARPVWTPMHKLPMFRDCPRMDLAVVEDIERRLINLPSSAKWGRS